MRYQWIGEHNKGMTMEESRQQQARKISAAVTGPAQRLAIRHATRIDARGIAAQAWLLSDNGVVLAQGAGEDNYRTALRAYGMEDAENVTIIDAQEALMLPGYVDLHAHGAWQHSFDDGQEAIAVARAGHAMHGTTRQVLSLITNPVDVMCRNLQTVAQITKQRPDVLGSHMEGPFLALSRKGAHDPACLIAPEAGIVERFLDAAQGTLRQITIAPELPDGIDTIRTISASGAVAAVGHCDADYDTAKRGFDAGARLMTHMFNAMNGLHHRNPGPIPAAVEDPRVTIELINDGFHVHDAALRLAFRMAPHRIALVTDAMAATDCADGSYRLGELEVTVEGGHARLVSNGAIAGSTLVLEEAVRRAVQVLSVDPVQAVEAATLTPARALGLDVPNSITEAPLGLLSDGYAADILLADPKDWSVQHVWCAGRQIR